MAIAFGNTGNFALATGFTASYISVGGFSETCAVEDITPIDLADGATSFRTKIASGRKDAGGIEVTFFYDPQAAVEPVVGGTAIAATITHPGATSTRVGNGWFTEWNTGDLTDDEVIRGSGTWTWEGGTGTNRPVKAIV